MDVADLYNLRNFSFWGVPPQGTLAKTIKIPYFFFEDFRNFIFEILVLKYWREPTKTTVDLPQVK